MYYRMIVQPEHLITSRKAILQREIKQAGPSAGERFSDRPREVIIDTFRRRTAIEMKARPTKLVAEVCKKKRDEDGTTVHETGVTTA
ncbi:hypothetical protein DICVIV_14109 [Dictyocaulus viviparus]|uniref:Uncharacterized protein n=1 Tax=Dictyocaulus viviparus TaxID=29172 RepID=A0A0D8XBY4_DICVI|nr:hypothetical protein DICVIV_14109 [Dictyocaulus viviparus]